MIFDSDIDGIACKIQVTHYSPGRPMRITGSGFGDADPPEPEEFEYLLRNYDGSPAPELEAFVTDDDEARFLQEYLQRI